MTHRTLGSTSLSDDKDIDFSCAGRPIPTDRRSRTGHTLILLQVIDLLLDWRDEALCHGSMLVETSAHEMTVGPSFTHATATSLFNEGLVLT